MFYWKIYASAAAVIWHQFTVLRSLFTVTLRVWDEAMKMTNKLFVALVLAALAAGLAQAQTAKPRYVHEPDLRQMLPKFLTPQGFLDPKFAEATSQPSPYLTDFYGLQALADTTKEGIKRDFVPKFAEVAGEDENTITLKFKAGYTAKFYPHSAIKAAGQLIPRDHVAISGATWPELLKNLGDFRGLITANKLAKRYLLSNPFYREELVVARQLAKNPAPAPPRPSPGPTPAPTRLTAQEVNDEIDKFLKINGALARVYDAREAHGVIRAVVNRRREAVKLLPAIVLRNEDYGRVTRVLADGAAVKLELNIVNRLFPAGRTQRNLIAEIPGADKGDEIVMLGAHLDSHHLATGATDNAVGCAVMMEAARILQAAGAKPRRAIRLALWSGEEQRVLGSQEYVKKHFGAAENPQPDFDKLSAYFNLDTGTGRIRGMRVFGPPEAGEVLREMLAPLADLGVVSASVYSNRTAPGSDHAAFSVNGLPGVYIDQDPLEYGEFTWHTNLDTYERIVEEDARQAAIVIATVVWQTAMREEKLPRFAPDKMPPLNYFPERP